VSHSKYFHTRITQYGLHSVSLEIHIRKPLCYTNLVNMVFQLMFLSIDEKVYFLFMLNLCMLLRSSVI